MDQPKPKPKQDPSNKKEAEVFSELAGLSAEVAPLLFNIPLWGGQGSGKTTSLLTAIYYLSAPAQGVTLARVKDLERLASLSNNPAYSDLVGFERLAASTRDRLDELSELFLTRRSWPPGTDEPGIYLLELLTRKGLSHFLLFPDIRGGSYETHDASAKNALTAAHGHIIFVDSTRYGEESPRGKEHKSDTLIAINRATKEKSPVLVLLTKIDDVDASKLVDGVETDLRAIFNGLGDPVHRISRVSVLGPTSDLKTAELPDPASRHPEALLEAWAWLLLQVLKRPAIEITSRVPILDIASAREPAELASRQVREVRRYHGSTESYGALVGNSSSDRSDSYFCLKDGSVREVVVDASTKQLRTKGQSHADGWDESPSARSFELSGTILLAPATATKAIWLGQKGGKLSKSPLPTPLIGWTAIDGGTIVGLDANGTLHLLKHRDGKWVTAEYLPDALAPGASAAISYRSRDRSVWVCNGDQIRGFETTKTGFGPRKEVTSGFKCDGPAVEVNELAFAVGRRVDGTLVVGRETTAAMPQSKPGSPFALAQNSPTVAWITPQNQLSLAVIQQNGKPTAAETVPTLEEEAISILLNAKGSEALVSLASGKLILAGKVGF